MRIAVAALSLLVTGCDALDAFRETEVTSPTVVDSSTTSYSCPTGDPCTTPGSTVRTCACGKDSVILVCCGVDRTAYSRGCQDTWTRPSCSPRVADTGSLDVAETLGCAECQQELCRDEQLACQSDAAASACNALIDCINKCPDAACSNACLDAGNPEGRALVQCVVDKCADACSGAP